MIVLDQNKVVIHTTELRGGDMLLKWQELKDAIQAIEELHQDKGIPAPKGARIAWAYADSEDDGSWFAIETEYKIPITKGKDNGEV